MLTEVGTKSLNIPKTDLDGKNGTKTVLKQFSVSSP